MSTELQSGVIRWKLWKSSCGYPVDVGFGRRKIKGWKAIAGRPRQELVRMWAWRWTLDEGQAGYGGDGGGR